MRWMTQVWLYTILATVAASTVQAEDGFQSLFDGKTLKDWDGNPAFWRVEEGCLTGETTPDNPTKGNTFIIYRGGDVADFELKFDYKIVGGNSGAQYRSFEVPDQKWVIGGYQADIDSGDTYSGINYGERFRGILANRGLKTVVKKGADGKVKVEQVEKLGDSKEIQSKIKKDDWNSYHIIAKGFTFEHRINGVTTSICTDEHPDRRASGLLALQLHAGPPMKVQFKNIELKKLDAKTAASDERSGEKKQVLLLAGRRSHGFGAHDHTAGCALLAKQLNESGLPVSATVHALEKDGWPAADKLAAADTIVIYADGGNGHPFNTHLDELQALMDKGTGVVCIHYGVEVPKGPSGEALLKWTGGYFEPDWSVNPHWVANYKSFPDHPITRGVEPFKINDEWYYHMRFRDDLNGVTPILTDTPTDATLTRPDGPHSGNAAVRRAVANKEPQHMAWATERADGGRGFGCTGGHVHWNWGNDQFRQLFLNAIVWTAGLDVPADGVSSPSVTVDDLLQDHDEPIPADFNKARVEAMLKEWNAQ